MGPAGVVVVDVVVTGVVTEVVVIGVVADVVVVIGVVVVSGSPQPLISDPLTKMTAMIMNRIFFITGLYPP